MMVTTARGIVFTAPNQVALETFELAEPGPDQALVKLHRSLVSAGTEVSGLLGQGRGGWPRRPGYSAVGTVLAVGEGVTGVRPGDRVLTTGRHASHLLVTLDGAAEHRPAESRELSAPRRASGFLQPIPPGVSDDAAAFTVLGAVAHHGIRKVPFQLGESCIVFGLGVVGQLLAQMARIAGANPVIGVDLVPSRLELGRRSGLHAALSPAQEDVPAAVLRLTGGQGVDVGFEATRSATAFRQLLRVAALNGRIVVVGSVFATAELDLFEDLQAKELTIIGAWQPRAPIEGHPYFRWTQHQNRQLFLTLLASGTIRVDHLISHRLAPEDAPGMYAEMATSQAEWLGVLIDWDR